MNINPAKLSKINWTQVVGAGAVLVTLFGVEVTEEQKVQIVAGIALASQALTFVFRTFFTAKP